MANEIKTIKLSEIKPNGKYINIKSEDGVEYGVNQDKSPKLFAILEKAKVGDSVTGEAFQWNTKWFLSDPKENKGGGGKSFAPKDKSYEAAVSSFEAACQAYSLDKEKTDDKIMALTQKGYDFIMGKVTKTTEIK